MDDYINVIDFIFLNLAFAVTFTGVIINNFEKYVPAFIIKGYRYGSFAYQGSDANFLQVIEIPKAYYRHFYLFSTLFSVSMLSYMFVVYFFGITVSFPVHFVLKVLLQENEPSVSITAALIAMTLLTIQCTRRLYETYYLQVFAKASKMNLSHYLVGIIHYFACIIAVVGQAPLFCGHQQPDTIKWNDLRTSIFAVPCTVVFLITWYEQFRTNIIFANLRKDKKSGEVVTEEHKIPHGRMFDYVSSPHRMCEIVLYTVLLILIPTKTFFCIYLWVLGNQIRGRFRISCLILLFSTMEKAMYSETEVGAMTSQSPPVATGNFYSHLPPVAIPAGATGNERFKPRSKPTNGTRSLLKSTPLTDLRCFRAYCSWRAILN